MLSAELEKEIMPSHPLTDQLDYTGTEEYCADHRPWKFDAESTIDCMFIRFTGFNSMSQTDRLSTEEM